MSYSLYRAMIQRSLRHLSGLARMSLFATVLSWVTIVSTEGYAESVSSSGETGVSLGGQDTDGFSMSLPGGLTTFVVIFSFLIILSFWLSPVRLIAWSRLPIGGRLKPLRLGPSASNLFLPTRYSVEDEAFEGWLRAINLHGATLIVGKQIPKGAPLTLQTGALPDFPEENTSLSAHVTSSRSLGGHPESWLIDIEWRQIESAVSGPLRSYVESLCPKKRSAYGHA